MNAFTRRLTQIVLLLSLLLTVEEAQSQLIPVRSVPVASGDQFRLLPSQSMGMGNVHYAIDDSLSDPWSNPALGTLNSVSLFMGSPTFYSIENGDGSGKSFPLGAILVGDRWFGGLSLAFQQISNPRSGTPFFFPEPADQSFFCCPTGNLPLSDANGRNLYASGFVGRRVDEQWSVGLGLASSRVDAMDGVDLLYAGADRIDQSGGVTDIRLGAVREGERDRVDLVLAHNRVSMTHDVRFTDWRWNDSLMAPDITQRTELNEDQTRTWALEGVWSRALSIEGWSIGATGAVNYKSHPKIPNYTLQNIPRDPGTTWAYRLGFGFAVREEASTFAVDVALEPIWSTTWQEANQDDVAASGGRLSVGDRSIENDFFFTNVVLRSGLDYRVGIVGLQAGVEMRSISYTLDQVDRVENTFRDQDESWVEWSPTLGAVFDFEGLDFRYGLRMTQGTGRPGIATDFFGAEDTALSAGDVILAPEGPLTLLDTSVVTHQFSVTVPIR